MFFSSSSGDRSYTVFFRTVDTLHSSYLLRPKDSRALLWHLIRRSWDEREKEIELLGFSDTRKAVEEKGPGKYRVSQRITVSSSTVSFLSTLPRPRTVVEKAPLPFLLLHNSVHGIIRRYLISAMNRGRKFSPLRLLRNKSREAEEEGGGEEEGFAREEYRFHRVLRGTLLVFPPRSTRDTSEGGHYRKSSGPPPSAVQAPRRNESRSRYTRYNVACNSRLFPILWPI